tara:strand:+ start:152 stop:505 length:354 start_codon:yes stop_codon:yes gene_type:complete
MEIETPSAPELASIIYGKKIPTKNPKEKRNLINRISKKYKKMFPEEFPKLEERLSSEIEQLCYDRTFCKYAGISYNEIDEHIIDIKAGVAIYLQRNFKKNIETKVENELVYSSERKL